MVSGSAQAMWPQQCEVTPDWVQPSSTSDDISPALYNAVQVTADQANVLHNSYASYLGNVELRHNQQLLQTESAEYNQITGEIRADGGLYFNDGYVAVRGDTFHAHTLQQSATIQDIDYHLVGTSALGSASVLDIQESGGYQNLNFRRASFTTCPGDRPAWQVRARRIEMKEDESWGVAHGAQVRLFNVPVIYIPRFSFPLTDERKSGLLYPTVRSSSRNGLEFEIPYYFNLSPNYDATLTPRYMSERGLMGMAEQRYLSEDHQGQFNIEYLNNDSSRQADNSRFFWRVEHEAEFSSRWSGYVDTSHVSDVNYFNDFGSQFASPADAHIYRRGQVDYQHQNWTAQVQVEDFQMLGPYQNPYRTMPRISVWHESDLPTRQGFTTQWFSEITQFQRQDMADENATRVHMEPGLSYYMRRPGWEWQAETSMLLTHYEQQKFEEEQLNSNSITRALPELRWHGQINLERPLDFSGNGGLQTLQPQLQFLYTPYRDQRDIGIYDSIPMQDDYNGLFRPRRFTGLDRIADANQITLGATTSIFNHRAEELMRLSLGQIFYFDDSQTQLFDDTTQITDNNSELAAELDFRFGSRWYFSLGAQYDSQLNQMQKSRSAVEYRKDSNNLIQLNHRQIRGLVGTEADVEQLGLVTTWQVHQDWSIAGHWYQDLRNGDALDVNFGFQYERCCWALRVSGYRRIDRNFEGISSTQPLTPAEFDNGISLQFVITGLSGDRSSLSNLLQQGIFGYRRPFYLSN
ncbi:LPS-assembly protein LptD [Aliidiomarina minuta]|uniref:LPS-assembly protein LptD n=2 Tax=Aliidiomarina minuta TaxID=880057 RepID=A0A432W4E4_9GAMM|nr:LPS-assembly protein LptD [Aliidiomarina minuta]